MSAVIPPPASPENPASPWIDTKTALRPRQAGEGLPPQPTAWALVVYAGSSLGRLFMLGPGENLLGRSPQAAIVLADEEVSRLHARLTLSSREGRETATLEDLDSTNGTLVNGVPVAGPTPLASGDRIALGGHVLKLTAMDPLERAFHETLLDQSTRDPLTGLHNRGAILEELGSRFDLARRHDRPLTVVICDLDHFKRINDTHGHGAGDLVLAAFGERVSTRLRASDLAGRIGGEEFLLVLPETDREGGIQLAERLRQAIAEEPVPIPFDSLNTTCSLGVAQLRADDPDIGAMVGRADAALYRAKHGGRNRVEASD